MHKRDVAVVLLIFAVSVLLTFYWFPGPYDVQVSEPNYNRITSGMTIAQVTAYIGEGEIYCLDNRGLIVMKYVGEDIKIRVVFVHGIVYQKSLELDDIVTSQVDLFTPEKT
jgi:hypothetical protein